MQAFTALVVALRQGRPPVPEKITVTAENEGKASYLAEIVARERYPGCTPLIKGVLLAECPHEQIPQPIRPVEGTVPEKLVHAATEDKTEGLRDYDRPQPRPFAEWKAMPWFSLKKYAVHAIKGTGAAAPTNQKDALVILQERGLVKP